MSRLRHSPAARVLALAAAVLGAVLITVGRAGGGVTIVVALAVVAILVAQRRRFAALPRGERAPLRHAVVQGWWAPVAGLLGLAMILAGIATRFEAHTLGGQIVGSSVLTAFGLAMLFGLVRRPFTRQAGNSLILVATTPPPVLLGHRAADRRHRRVDRRAQGRLQRPTGRVHDVSSIVLSAAGTGPIPASASTSTARRELAHHAGHADIPARTGPRRPQPPPGLAAPDA